MSNLHAIRANPGSLIADGLEGTALAIREGHVRPYRAILVLVCREGDDDAVGAHVYGADASAAEVVGNLEQMKHQVLMGGVDGD